MIEKSKIKKGLIFWKSCESVIRIPNSNIYIKSPVGLMQIEEFVNYNLVTCSLYCKELFGAQVVVASDYIKKYATEIVLDNADRQEMIYLHNSIAFERLINHDWSAKVPDSLKGRVSNFLCRDFYQKYNLKEE